MICEYQVRRHVCLVDSGQRICALDKCADAHIIIPFHLHHSLLLSHTLLHLFDETLLLLAKLLVDRHEVFDEGVDGGFVGGRWWCMIQ